MFSSFAFFGLLANLLILAIVLLVLYLIIQAAVRNAIDHSETGKTLRKYLEQKTRIDAKKNDDL